jgi:hypothetical protein
VRTPPAATGGALPTPGDDTPPPWANLLVINGQPVFGSGPAVTPLAAPRTDGVPSPQSTGADTGPDPDYDDGSWVKLPTWLLGHPELTGTDVTVWAAVTFYAGRSGVCFADRERIAARACGVSVDTVKRALRALEAAGAITIQHRHRQSSLIWPRVRPVRPVIDTPLELGEIIDTAAGHEPPLPDPGPEPTAAELDARARGMSWAEIARALAAGEL